MGTYYNLPLMLGHSRQHKDMLPLFLLMSMRPLGDLIAGRIDLVSQVGSRLSHC